jgi:Ferric iron reductase FhuF-like transporter
MLEQIQALGLDRVAMTAPPSAEVVRGDRFLDPEYLRRAIWDAGASFVGHLPAQPDSDEQREVKLTAAASRFTRYYIASLSFVALVGLARGVGLDLAVHRCTKTIAHGLPRDVVLDDLGDDVVTCAERPAAWPIEGSTVGSIDDLRQHVWRQLYGQNFAPLVSLTQKASRATGKLLWSNAAEMVAYVADQAAVSLSPSEAAPFIEDADALLNAEALPGVAGPNPMRGLIERVSVDEPDLPLGLHTRPHCCITYVLPVRTGLLCGNCPFLPVEDRIALVRERRSGERGGPAELHSIAVGRRRIRTEE